jgi:very-short-patch-repair endonuclease
MNILSYKKNLKPLSRDLRNNQTSAEQILWAYLRKKQILDVRFTRQKPIDFYAKEKRLVIEVDGIDHYSEKGKSKDHKRDEYFKSLGLTVLRFNNLEVKCALEAVIQAIEFTILGKPYKKSHGEFVDLSA